MALIANVKVPLRSYCGTPRNAISNEGGRLYINNTKITLKKRHKSKWSILHIPSLLKLLDKQAKITFDINQKPSLLTVTVQKSAAWTFCKTSPFMFHRRKRVQIVSKDMRVKSHFFFCHSD